MMENINLFIISVGFIACVVGLGMLPVKPNKRILEDTFKEEVQKSFGFKILVVGFYTSCFGIITGLLRFAFGQIKID